MKTEVAMSKGIFWQKHSSIWRLRYEGISSTNIIRGLRIVSRKLYHNILFIRMRDL